MLAIIGGSGLYSLGDEFHLGDQCARQTPYGETSADVLLVRWQDVDIAFLPRHGPGHSVPPHLVNYRANLWALKQAGVSKIIAVNAVGGISADMAPSRIALPQQLIDYSWGREHSFCDGHDAVVQHVDFSRPYSATLQASLKRAAAKLDLAIVDSGTYGCTNGPRFETIAEAVALEAGVKPEEIIAVGDDTNDIEMIRNAGLGIAMGNAAPAVKQAADRVVRSNAEGGVVEAIEKTLLLI